MVFCANLLHNEVRAILRALWYSRYFDQSSGCFMLLSTGIYWCNKVHENFCVVLYMQALQTHSSKISFVQQSLWKIDPRSLYYFYWHPSLAWSFHKEDNGIPSCRNLWDFDCLADLCPKVFINPYLRHFLSFCVPSSVSSYFFFNAPIRFHLNLSFIRNFQ